MHASADLAYVDDLVCDEAALGAGAGGAARRRARGHRRGDGRRRHHPGRPTRLPGRRARRRRAGRAAGITRSAAAVRIALNRVGPGAVWVVGCAPTALCRTAHLDAAPALVVGLPVGFVGAAESKAALRASGLPAVSNVGGEGRLGGRRRRPQRPALRRGEVMTGLVIVGHGTRSAAGVEQFAALVERVRGSRGRRRRRGRLHRAVPPAADRRRRRSRRRAGTGRWWRCRWCSPPPVTARATSPPRMAREQERHPGLSYRYGRPLGPHPLLHDALEERIDAALAGADRADAWPVERGRPGRHVGRVDRAGFHRPGRQRRGRQGRPAALGGARLRGRRARRSSPWRSRRCRPCWSGCAASARGGSSSRRTSCSPACCRTGSSPSRRSSPPPTPTWTCASPR